MLVHHGVDLLAGRNTDDLAAEGFLVDEKPIRSLDDLGLVETTLSEALGAILGPDGDDITDLEGGGGDVALATVHGDVAVGDHLAGAGAGLGKAHTVDDVVEAGLKKLKQDETGDATRLQSGLEIAAELALKHSVLETKLLLLGQRGAVLGNLAAGALGSVHAGGISLVLESAG